MAAGINWQLRKLENWWSRRCGGRQVLVLALPLIISTMSWTLMSFIDRMFLLWHSDVSMAAALPSGMLWFTVASISYGLACYVNTFVAQYHGAGRHGRIGTVVGQGVYLAVLATPFLMLTVLGAPYLFRWMGHAPALAGEETTYYQTLGYGIGAWLVAVTLSGFFTGRGQTSLVMLVDSIAALVNIVLDYAWIFGKFGFPAGGIEGAAWATVVAHWSAVAMYVALMARPAYRRYRLMAGLRWNRDLMVRLLRFGLPSGIQVFIDVAGFTMITLMVGRLGQQAMAATTLAININSMAFVPMIGLSIAVGTIVGQQLGRNRADLAARGTWTSLVLAMAYMGTISVLYVAAPGLFLFGHASGTDPAVFASLHGTVVILLRFVAAYSLFDGMNLVFCGAIKGAGDTRFVLYIGGMVSPVAVAITWVGLQWFGFGLWGCWAVLTAWVMVQGLAYMGRFLHGNWRKMRVIEQPLLQEAAARPNSGEEPDPALATSP